MNTHPVRRLLSAHRVRGLALAGSALTLLLMLCLQLGAFSRAAWAAVLSPGPASLDQAMAAGCASLATVLVMWLLGALMLSLLAALISESSALGSALAEAARLAAPRVLRNTVAALLGVTLAAAPAAADAAVGDVAIGSVGGIAASGPTFTPVTGPRADSDPGLSPAWIGAGGMSAPRAERSASTTTATSRATPSLPPTAASSAQAIAASSAPTPKPLADLLPGWTPDLPGRTPDLSREVVPSRTGGPGPFPTSAVPSTGADAPARSRTRAGSDTRGGSDSRAGARAAGTRSKDAAPVASSPRRALVDLDDEIVVRRGDTLWSLAERHLGPSATDGEIAVEWPRWFTANRAVIGSDPDHLVPGERLRPPTAIASDAATGGRPQSRVVR